MALLWKSVLDRGRGRPWAMTSSVTVASPEVETGGGQAVGCVASCAATRNTLSADWGKTCMEPRCGRWTEQQKPGLDSKAGGALVPTEQSSFNLRLPASVIGELAPTARCGALQRRGSCLRGSFESPLVPEAAFDGAPLSLVRRSRAWNLMFFSKLRFLLLDFSARCRGSSVPRPV